MNLSFVINEQLENNPLEQIEDLEKQKFNLERNSRNKTILKSLGYFILSYTAAGLFLIGCPYVIPPEHAANNKVKFYTFASIIGLGLKDAIKEDEYQNKINEEIEKEFQKMKDKINKKNYTR